MVEKIFRTNPYLDSCEAKITSIKEGTLTLDQTVFFAFSGGQESDAGTINDFPVKEAIAEGSEIYYVLGDGTDLHKGDGVVVNIDAEKRRKIMRLHSAAHLVYGIFSEQTGLKKLIGSNITSDKARIDFENETSIGEKLPEVEKEANGLIEAALPIRTYQDEKHPDKWWWECGNWKFPCGGTHTKSLGEIGKIKLKRKNIGAGKERIEITLEKE